MRWIGAFFRKKKKDEHVTESQSENYKQETDSKVKEEAAFIWCLVGNIVDMRYSKVDEMVKYGTKHFSPNTKVYCLPAQWGDGYENIKVIGKHRKTTKYVCIVTPSKYITNWRMQKVYRPYILNVMKTHIGWTDSEYHKNIILQMLEWVPEETSKKWREDFPES